MNGTVPVGVPVPDGATVAVKVTDGPRVLGFSDEVSVVVVAAWATTIFLVVELFPLVPSLVAPVLAVTLDVPAALGDPETEHVIVVPAASEATGVAGVQVPNARLLGSPLMLHVALVAAAVPTALLLVQVMLPE